MNYCGIAFMAAMVILFGVVAPIVMAKEKAESD